MSGETILRRSELAMDAAAAAEFVAQGFAGRLATIGADGYPYCVPLLYVWLDGQIYLHGTSASGHLRRNIDHAHKVCFEIDEPGAVYAYGRFECDTTLSYRSVILFGTVRIIEDVTLKQRFCDALMAKYAAAEWQRPKSFYPRLGGITVYAVAIERVTGKAIALPGIAEQWPAKDRTKTPAARE
jgi:nitroimidazol reductase NimA-like FMN-containing flavoprotein (pyridoxamine 5'-phosphate oxidase superfamily)